MPDDIPDSIAAPDASQGGPQGGAPAPFMDSAAALLGGAPDPSAGGMSMQPSQPSETTLQPNPIADYPSSPREDQHMGLIHRILDKASSILGGDETLHIKKDTDGNVTVTRDPSTQGEKWGRVAAAALGGLASGLPQSFGPQGVANAASAGFKTGAAMPQQREQQAQQQATAEQQTMMRNAQKALLQQQIVSNAFEAKTRGLVFSQAQSDRANADEAFTTSAPNNEHLADFKSMDEAMEYERTHGDLLKGHAGGQFHTNVMPDGTVRVYRLDPAWANQMNDKDVDVPVLKFDTKGQPYVDTKHITKGTQTNGSIEQFNEGQTAQLMKFHVSQDQEADRKEAIAAREQARADTERHQRIEEQQGQQRIGLEQQRINQTNPLGASGGGAGLHGEAYLNSIPADMREQVKSIAAGNAKMPSGARSGSVQALRNAVFNYDPTYTDARYDTKQNFKTKGDAQNMTSLATALGHLENAQQNSKKVGFAPLLSRNATDADAAYNKDIDFLTHEAGKLIKNNVLTQGEYNDLKKGLDSSRQGIRDAAIGETIKLMGSRVQANFQKYKTGAGQDIPLQEFFDAPTQARLQKYGLAGGAGAGPQQGAPQGATMKVPGSDGQLHWSDGQNDLGVVQP